MDNICHTLVGAALGEAGLKRRTRFGTLTLMLAANIPDVDVLVFASGTAPVAFPRGWTHGVVAQALLPVLLTATVVMIARLRFRTRDERGDAPISIPWLLALSYLGLYSHLILDYVNNYGVRLLAPIDWRWFYGDAVFIVDPWLWAALGAGVWLSRRTERDAPARGSLLFAAAYVAMLVASAQAARGLVLDSWQATRGQAPRAFMVGPVPVVPHLRHVIVDSGDHYETGTFSWTSGSVHFSEGSVQKQNDRPEVLRARDAPNVRAFLVWSRFPYWEIEPTGDGARVTVRDMRFGNRFAASTIVPQ